MAKVSNFYFKLHKIIYPTQEITFFFLLANGCTCTFNWQIAIQMFKEKNKTPNSFLTSIDRSDKILELENKNEEVKTTS